MAHKIAKLFLEHAGTFLERKEAIRAAIKLGMPLAEIEEYLDWLDAVRAEQGTESAAAEEAECDAPVIPDGATSPQNDVPSEEGQTVADEESESPDHPSSTQREDCEAEADRPGQARDKPR